MRVLLLVSYWTQNGTILEQLEECLDHILLGLEVEQKGFAILRKLLMPGHCQGRFTCHLGPRAQKNRCTLLLDQALSQKTGCALF